MTKKVLSNTRNKDILVYNFTKERSYIIEGRKKEGVFPLKKKITFFISKNPYVNYT